MSVPFTAALSADSQQVNADERLSESLIEDNLTFPSPARNIFSRPPPLLQECGSDRPIRTARSDMKHRCNANPHDHPGIIRAPFILKCQKATHAFLTSQLSRAKESF